MADLIGNLESRFGVADIPTEYYAGRQVIPLQLHGDINGTVFDWTISGNWVSQPETPRYPAVYGGLRGLELGDFWFDIIHVFPRSIDVGILVTLTQFQIDIYNAFREEDKDWEDYTNNVDTGFNIINLPSLPYTMEAQSGISLTLEASPNGPPTISGTLDFGFLPYDIAIIVKGIRVVLFTFRPEEPMKEGMIFLTDIITSLSGQEQRIALRKNPRQVFDMTVQKQAPERQAVENTLFDWQPRIFGVPVWYEPMMLSSAVSIGDLTIDVNGTDYKDLRIGSLAVIRETWQVFDALEIESFTANTITFVSGLTHNYSSGVEVYPVRRCYAEETIKGYKSTLDLESYTMRFKVVDNDSDLADDSAFNQKDGKVILDGYNFIEGTMGETFRQKIRKLDNETGLFSQSSLWEKNQRYSRYTFIVDGAQELWEVRQLLHFFKGQQASFYLPTSYSDFTPSEPLTSGNSTITMANIGYTRFARLRWPKIDIRIHLHDGTILLREILGASELDELTEQLTVDIPWPSTIQPEDILRIELIELVRLSEDGIEIIHENGYGTAMITLPVKGVFDI